MLFRQMFDKTSSTYTYLIASGRGREAVIIDPVKESTEAYLGLIDQLDLKLYAVAAYCLILIGLENDLFR